MNNLFILSVNDRAIGVYTSHMKAVQAAIMDTLPFSYTLTDYSYELGVEFYTFTDKSYTEKIYSIQEVTPDTRV